MLEWQSAVRDDIQESSRFYLEEDKKGTMCKHRVTLVTISPPKSF